MRNCFKKIKENTFFLVKIWEKFTALKNGIEKFTFFKNLRENNGINNSYFQFANTVQMLSVIP